MHFSCIIPAYNEGPYIAKIIESCLACELLDEIIVINDGSTDNTWQMISTFTNPRLKKINLTNNRGKLGAFFEGVRIANGDYIFMVDADYIGFTTEHIHKLLDPIRRNEADMTIMMWQNSMTICKVFKHDILSGTRALPRYIFKDESYFFSGKGFALESRINELIYTKKLTVKSLYFADVYNPPKGFKQLFWRQPKDILRVISPWRILQHMWYIYRQQ